MLAACSSLRCQQTGGRSRAEAGWLRGGSARVGWACWRHAAQHTAGGEGPPVRLLQAPPVCQLLRPLPVQVVTARMVVGTDQAAQDPGVGQRRDLISLSFTFLMKKVGGAGSMTLGSGTGGM